MIQAGWGRVFFEAVIFLMGAAVGSFLNVCIRRMPAGESLVFPGSHCPQCHSPIKYYDNIPIASFLFLGGKCRNCRGRISLRYPMVELIVGLTGLVFFWKFGLTLKFLAVFIFSCSLVVITFIDLDHQIIPDVITLPGIPVSFIAAVFVMGVSWREAALGVLIGGGVLYAIAFTYEIIAKREGMGGGDIKLLAMLGGFFGWKSLIFILLVSSFTGAVLGVAIMLFRGKDMKYAVPFGPFLSFAALAFIFWGDKFNRLLFHLYA